MRSAVQGRMAVQESLLHSAIALPWPVLALVVLAAILTLRLVSNRLTFDAPPVFEGLPFVGGLLKFMGVRAEQLTLLACSQLIWL